MSTPRFYTIGKHRGKPGEGTKMLSPLSQRVFIVLFRAAAQPKVKKTLFGSIG